MAINVADNFSYKGSKPLDARIKANTVSALVSTPAADLYDGCFAYVTETKKYYSYDSTNTSDPTLGKWREFQQGGGGEASALDDLTDVKLTSPSNNQVLKYNSQTGKWENANESGGGGSLPAGGTTGQSLVKHSDSDNDAEWFDVNKEISFNDFNELTQEEKDNGTSYYIPDATVVSGITVMGNRFDKANIYTDTERMIGSWMGKPLYQKTINFGHNYDSNNRITKTLTEIGISNLDKFVYMEGIALASGGAAMPVPMAQSSSEIICLYYATSITSIIILCTAASWKDRDIYITLQYTKTTDTTVNIGTGNDYSTDEQIIGTWIDGKPLYQKTYQVPDASFASKTDKYLIITVDENIDNINIINNFANFIYSLGSQIYNLKDGETLYSNDGSKIILTSGLYKVNHVSPAILRFKFTQTNDTTLDKTISNCYVILQYTKTTD